MMRQYDSSTGVALAKTVGFDASYVVSDDGRDADLITLRSQQGTVVYEAHSWAEACGFLNGILWCRGRVS